MPVYLLGESIAFPPPEEAEEGGLLAFGGDLSPARLCLAYECGIFPWYSEGEPIAWYSPDPRLVMRPSALRVTKSLRRALRHCEVEIAFDRAFPEVIERCASVRRRDEDGTWITRDMVRAYVRLHDAGHAHSVEAYADGALVGGLYGVSVGRCFCGESMFSAVDGASKAAFACLADRLAAWDFAMIDCQLPVLHLERLGAESWSRADYLAELRHAVRQPGRPGSWRAEPVTTNEALLERLGRDRT